MNYYDQAEQADGASGGELAMRHPHEIEELEMRYGPRMWDATPGVCCAYLQTGACDHTEAFNQDEIDELVALDPPTECPAIHVDDVPF